MLGVGKGRKKANREGSVYQRKNGRWEAALSYRTPAGKLERRRNYHATREEADRALTRMKSERDAGIALGGPNPRLSEYLISWLRDSVATSVDPKTLEGYEVACRIHIIPALGGVRIRDLTARQVQGLYAEKLRAGLSVRTRRNIHATLKRALKQAVAWGELASSPAEMLDAPKALAKDEDAERPIEHLTDAEARRLFAAARETGSRFRNLYVVATRTGLRQGEILGLKWEDLDLDQDPAALMLRRSLAPNTEGGGYRFTPTKRKRQRRRLALHWEAADALRDQTELQAMEREAAGKRWQENGLVFPSTRGTPMSARNLYGRDFKPLLGRAELPDVSFHALRHSFATIMLYEWEVDPKTVQEMLGHASIKITMDTYSHFLPSQQADAIRRLRRMFSGDVADSRAN